MGRGRAKAKQQKVARELKYNTHFTDLDALQRELGVSDGNGSAAASTHRAEVDEDSYRGVDGEPDDDYESWTGTDR